MITVESGIERHPEYDQDMLLRVGDVSGERWVRLATTVMWLVLALTIAVVTVLRSEVK